VVSDETFQHLQTTGCRYTIDIYCANFTNMWRTVLEEGFSGHVGPKIWTFYVTVAYLVLILLRSLNAVVSFSVFSFLFRFGLSGVFVGAVSVSITVAIPSRFL
jgi:hypothetical protein